MKLNSITIIGMHKVKEKTYVLSNFNYLCGKNGAGKSTVMQAIQLALLGYIPSTDKNKTAIFRHSNGDVMSVSLTFDNNSSITRTWSKSGKDIKATATVSPITLDVENVVSDLELPIFNFSDFVGMTANKLKDWFINFLPTADSKVDWHSELRNSILTLTTDCSIASTVADNIISTFGTDIESVRSFNQECKTKISMLKTDIARMQSTVQELIHYDDCDMSLNEEDLNKQISENEILLTGLNNKLFKYDQNLRVKETLDSVADIINGYGDKLDNPAFKEDSLRLAELESDLNAHTTKRSELNAEMSIIVANARSKQNVIDKHGVCPYTNESCESIEKMISQYIEENKSADAQVEDLNNAIRAIDAEINILQSNIKDTNNIIGKIDSAYMLYSSNIGLYDKELAAQSKDDISTEISDLSATLKELREKLVKVSANKKYDSLMEVLTTGKLKAEHELEIYKAWEKLTSVNGLQSKLMNAPFISFSNNITDYLQKLYDSTNVFASFNIGEKANSFSFGMIRDGKYIDFDLLSSGEKCLYTLALSLAIVDASKSELKLLLVDDLLDHLDPANIENCFSTLYNITSVQTIVAGVQPCSLNESDAIINI